MSRFNYDDVEELESMRREANRRLDNPDYSKLGFVVFVAIVGALWLFFSWLHNSIAKFTGPEAATWIIWIGVACVAAFFVYLFFAQRAAHSNAQRVERARLQRVIAEANEESD